MTITESPGTADLQPTVRYDHVLVPLDGTERSTVALLTARVLAERFGAKLHTIGVAGDAAAREQLRHDAAEALGGVTTSAEVHTVDGNDPAAAINALSDSLGSCLVCMSTHGHGRVVGAVLGSVATSVVQGSHVPTVVVGPLADRREYFDSTARAPLAIDRIVVCVDAATDNAGRQIARDMVAVAAAWARTLSMRLSIVTVAPHSTSLSASEQTARVTATLEGLATSAADLGAGPVDTQVVFDPIDPGAGIREHLATHPAGLLVVSTHARTGARRLAHGANAAAIVAVAPIATLVVPTR